MTSNEDNPRSAWAAAADIARWVPLGNLLAVISADFEVEPAQAARIVRQELEAHDPGGDHGQGIGHRVVVRLSVLPESARRLVEANGFHDPYLVPVSRAGGWSAVDWIAGTIKGHVIEVNWQDTARVLHASGIRPRARAAKQTDSSPLRRRPSDVAVKAWMEGTVREAAKTGPLPKRDPTLQQCVSETDATYRQARNAWDALPDELKRQRGQRGP